LLFVSGVSSLATLIGGLSFQLFFSRPGCSGIFLAILLFILGVSLLATLIGRLKRLFSYFALGQDAQAYFQPFCFLFRVLAC
jgi:hypothetical protein